MTLTLVSIVFDCLYFQSKVTGLIHNVQSLHLMCSGMELSMLVVLVSSWATGLGMESLPMTWLNVTLTATANGQMCLSCVPKLENPMASTMWVRKIQDDCTIIGQKLLFLLLLNSLLSLYHWSLQLVTLRRSVLLAGQPAGQAVFTSCWRTKHLWAFMLAGNNLTGSTNLEMTLDTSKTSL